MAGFFSDFQDGLSAYVEAIRLVKKLRLWKYFILPGVISLVIGVVIFFGAYKTGIWLSGRVEDWIPWEGIANAASVLAGIFSGILSAIIGLFLYKYIVLILVSPFMSPLSDKVEKYLMGENYNQIHFSFKGAVNDLIRGLRINVRNIFRELFFTILLLLFGLIPVIGLLSAIFLFALQAYYAGFGNMDYTLERHYGVRGSVNFVRAHKGLAVSNGTPFILLLAVPFVGLILAPGLSTIAGTLSCTRRIPIRKAPLTPGH